MEFEDIGRVWRDGDTGALRRTRVEDLSDVLEGAAGYNAKARRRIGIVAVVVALPLVPAYIWMAAGAPNLVASSGAALMAVFSAVAFVRYLAIARQRVDPALPVRMAVEEEAERLEALFHFRSTLRWPFRLGGVGYVLWAVGHVLETRDLSYALMWVAVFAGVLGLTIWGTRRRLRPGQGHAYRLPEPAPDGRTELVLSPR